MNIKSKLIAFAAVVVALVVVAIFQYRLRHFGAQALPKDTPHWYERLDAHCARAFTSEDCQNTLLQTLDHTQIWGDVAQNIETGDVAWPNSELTITLNSSDEEGGFAINLVDEKPAPFLTLSNKKSNLPEILLTLNHELVHYANSQKLKSAIASRKTLIDGCMSLYDKIVLLNENTAFQSEVKFWQMAPVWFKTLLKPVHFNSQFTGMKNTNYEEHYAYLAAQLLADPLYASKRYIELGKYPSCATQLISR